MGPHRQRHRRRGPPAAAQRGRDRHEQRRDPQPHQGDGERSRQGRDLAQRRGAVVDADRAAGRDDPQGGSAERQIRIRNPEGARREIPARPPGQVGRGRGRGRVPRVGARELRHRLRLGGRRRGRGGDLDRSEAVGWVERSETHHSDSLRVAMGFAALNPSYEEGGRPH